MRSRSPRRWKAEPKCNFAYNLSIQKSVRAIGRFFDEEEKERETPCTGNLCASSCALRRFCVRRWIHYSHQLSFCQAVFAFLFKLNCFSLQECVCFVHNLHVSPDAMFVSLHSFCFMLTFPLFSDSFSSGTFSPYPVSGMSISPENRFKAGFAGSTPDAPRHAPCRPPAPAQKRALLCHPRLQAPQPAATA